jgi:SnoaL-like domain
MTDRMKEVRWRSYSEAWADITPETREKLLDESVVTDCYFADPDTELQGFQAFTAHIEKFQRDYAGAYFETLEFIEHHRQSVARWMMHGKDGSDLLQGTTVARYETDGKMTHIAGFWKL